MILKTFKCIDCGKEAKAFSTAKRCSPCNIINEQKKHKEDYQRKKNLDKT